MPTVTTIIWADGTATEAHDFTTRANAIEFLNSCAETYDDENSPATALIRCDAYGPTVWVKRDLADTVVS